MARRTGGTFDTVSSILVKFNKVLLEAEPGKGASAVLKAIGLDAEELKRIDPAEALRQTAVAFAKFADDGSKARAFQELFGKSIREAGPLLTDLAKQTSLVSTVTTKAAEDAERFNQQLAGLSKNGLDVARQLSGPLVVALSATIDKFKELDRYLQKRGEQNAVDAVANAEARRAKSIELLTARLKGLNVMSQLRVQLERDLAALQIERCRTRERADHLDDRRGKKPTRRASRRSSCLPTRRPRRRRSTRCSATSTGSPRPRSRRST